MKRFTKMFCLIFVCMLAGTLTVHADDKEFNTGAGIRFEGSAETESEKETETQEETETEKKIVETEQKSTEKPVDKPSAPDNSKPSLPQTGQESGMLLQTVGVILLFLAGWWVVVWKRREDLPFLEGKRAG